MRARGCLIQGTTLAELLVATVFVAACSTALLGGVTTCSTRAAYAKHRLQMVGQAKAEFERVRSTGAKSSLTPATTVTNLTLPGLNGILKQTTTITLVAGYTNLYRISVAYQWNEQTRSGTRPESASFDTYVRAPDDK